MSKHMPGTCAVCGTADGENGVFFRDAMGNLLCKKCYERRQVEMAKLTEALNQGTASRSGWMRKVIDTYFHKAQK